LAQTYAFGGRDDEAIEIFDQVAASEGGVFSTISRLFASGLRYDRDQVMQILEVTDLGSIAMTDEYYPTNIAAALVLVGENDEAIAWIERAISWGFTNYRWLHDHNRFLEPLRGDPRFQALMEKAREKQEAFTV